MRPQHDGLDGRPSPQSQPEIPQPRPAETPFSGRVRQQRPEGKPGRHRLDESATHKALAATPQPLALPTAGSRPVAETAAPAEIVPAWRDLVERVPALTPEHLPASPAELTLARQDRVVAPQAAPEPWSFHPWGTPPAFDPAEVWDSTEEFSWGLNRDVVRRPQPITAAEEPLALAPAPAIFLPPPLDKVALAERVATVEDRYLTPAGPLTPGLAPVRRLRGAVKAARYAALGFIALLGVAAVVTQSEGPDDPQLSNTSQSIEDRSDGQPASRSHDRGPRDSPGADAGWVGDNPPAPITPPSYPPFASAKPSVAPSPSPSAKKATPAVLPLVAGFDKAQMTNARTIVQTGRKLGVPDRGLLIGLMTAMQESRLYNLASPAVPESFRYPHQGSGQDYDSCGLFQQRTSMGWGTVRQIMNPVYSSTKFFQGLQQVAGWQRMSLTGAAQAVQGSAFPYAYAQHEANARAILKALS
jgi:hypothetical protein